MSNWYETINNQTDSILEKIKDHPFIKDLMTGTLSEDVFYFYINQDALYLAEYKKVLAVVGTRCQEESDMQFFLDSACGIIHVENELHENFLKGKETFSEPSPACELYTSYLSRIVNTHSLEEGLAAVLPCFTIYKQIGDYILENQTNKNDNPYQDWINTYASEDFAIAVENAIKITNKYAKESNETTIKNMNLAFEKSSKLEWMFWDSAYKKEAWAI